MTVLLYIAAIGAALTALGAIGRTLWKAARALNQLVDNAVVLKGIAVEFEPDAGHSLVDRVDGNTAGIEAQRIILIAQGTSIVRIGETVDRIEDRLGKDD